MIELNEKHIDEVVSQLYKDHDGGGDAPINSLETLGKDFMEIEMEGRSSRETTIVFLINKNISRVNWLMGITTSAHIKATKNDPDNTSSTYTVFSSPKHLDIYPAVVKASIKIAEFLSDNFDLLCPEFQENWPPRFPRGNQICPNGRTCCF